MDNRSPIVDTVSRIYCAERIWTVGRPSAHWRACNRFHAPPNAAGAVDGQELARSNKLRSLLENAFHDSPYREMRRVAVDVTGLDRCVQLSGCVSSFYLKQLAQEIVRKTAPGQPIDNRVDVIGQTH